MVDDAIKVLHMRIDVKLAEDPVEGELERSFILGLHAKHVVLFADELDPSLLVGAQQGETPWHNHDWISLDDVTPVESSFHGDRVEVVGPLIVPDPRRSEGHAVDIGEHFFVVFEHLQQIHHRDGGESAAHGDPCDPKLFDSSLLLHAPEIVDDIFLDRLPHLVVLALHLAFGAHVGVLHLERIEDVFPDVQGGIRIPEGQDHKIIIDRQDALDILGLFLNVVRVHGLVLLGTHLAVPIVEIFVVVLPNDQGRGQAPLVQVGDRAGEGNQ